MQRLSLLLGLRPKDIRRLIIALGLILGIVLAGMVGYMLTAGLGLLDAFYMAIITISTVGFGELGEMDADARIFTIGLIVATMLWGGWALQSILGIILSKEFHEAVLQLRSIRKVRNMTNHTIICGFGRIGEAAASELLRNQEPFVVIDNDSQVIERLQEMGYRSISGDATEDETLLDAGITQAARLIATLDNDNDNIVTVLSARELNPKLWIASRLVHPNAEHKLRRAGANEIVWPYDYGGRRLALTVLRPHVAQFLSQVVFDEGRGAEMDELELGENSPLTGKTLKELALRSRFGITVIALYCTHEKHEGETGGFVLNPGPNTRLHAGDVLIVVGTRAQLHKLHHTLKS